MIMDQHNKINIDLPLEFKITRPVECPYLDFKMEQRLAANITRRPDVHDGLARAGFRRVENWVYKPVCMECSACVPIRVASGNIREGNIKISRNQRRVINRNDDLDRNILPNISIYDHFQLFSRYLASRHHDGQMAEMHFGGYNEMITASPIDTRLLEYRHKDEVIGVMLIDIQDDGISAVYSFYDPDVSDRSLGTYMVLDCAALAYEMGLDYVYLGYFIEESSKMNYKSRFAPAEHLISGEWIPIAEK
jgi:arginine-tRNA-protein transferase